MTTNTDAVPSLPDDLNPEIVKATAAFIGKITGLVPPPHDAFPREWYGYLRTFTARVKEIASENTTSAMQAEAVQVAEPVDYDAVVSICDAHGIGLPVDCIEMVVEIIRHAAPQPSQTAEVLDDEPTTIYDHVQVRAKFSDYQSQIDGLKEELEHARAASTQPVVLDDERAALPRYTEWLHLREHGQWSDGVPTWARDHSGRMNDATAANAVIEELARASSPQPVAQPVEQTRALTDDARAVITMLINLARTTYHALDNSEECTGDDGRFHAIGGPEFDEMSDALDALEELPDDRPGYTLAAPGKAEWALRALLTAASPASGETE